MRFHRKILGAKVYYYSKLKKPLSALWSSLRMVGGRGGAEGGMVETMDSADCLGGGGVILCQA